MARKALAGRNSRRCAAHTSADASIRSCSLGAVIHAIAIGDRGLEPVVAAGWSAATAVGAAAGAATGGMPSAFAGS
ncbi:hypothetical protein IVA95_22800 [Bradyrhizobium sp. 157]|nr:hypothetical protein [Bradyrhizobium sp. 157]